MKLFAVMFVAALAASVGGGCSSEDTPAFPTYQECFDDRPMDDLVPDKILHCCLDVLVDDQKPACGASTADCINYLTDNLSQNDASTVEVQGACGLYEDELAADGE